MSERASDFDFFQAGVIDKFMQNQQDARISAAQGEMAEAAQQVADRNYGPGSDAISSYMHE